MTWSDWPARRQPARALLALALVLSATAAVALVDRWLALLSALLLLGATREVLLPTRYTLDAEGVLLRGPLGSRRLRWAQLAGWRPAGEDLLLLGAGRHPLLARRRTVLLRRAPADAPRALHEQLGEPGFGAVGEAERSSAETGESPGPRERGPGTNG